MTPDDVPSNASISRRGQVPTELDAEQLQQINQALELVMTQLLVIERGEEVASMQYMARQCWELLYAPREWLRSCPSEPDS